MNLVDAFAPSIFRANQCIGGSFGQLPKAHAIHRAVHELAVTVRYQCRVNNFGRAAVIRSISHESDYRMEAS